MSAQPSARPFELPTELEIDAPIARRIIVEFVRAQLGQAGFERVVVGLSGGIDSSLVCHLVADAIGAERLLAVLMPYRSSAPESRADAETVVAGLGCASELVDISPMVDGYFGRPEAGIAGSVPPDQPSEPVDPTAVDPSARGEAAERTINLRRGNFMARIRMAVLYDRSVSWRGLVAGTGNKTETLIGYTTIYGDNASAFNPIGDLYKSQVRQLALEMGVPDRVIAKAPSADLWPGQTDESEVGLSYAELDRLLYWMVDRRRSDEDLVALGFAPAIVERVGRMVAGSEFKRQVPPIAKIGPRTAGIDYLYPRRRPGSARS
ncbi:MAG TPA: NAD(+) synthase [Candidatus Limnocylindrales bacterium]|jgi:NAD+ synthase|nr:NAD(+) synthase [Candidatus Limnocylindrales bacterium]